mmetsp:Transcript_4932/g.17137  ORF Transcript_4932/g.17137 Transcript_4932/m.17137 type:complete len:454 (+) Transcript_4932:89-1450(+)
MELTRTRANPGGLGIARARRAGAAAAFSSFDSLLLLLIAPLRVFRFVLFLCVILLVVAQVLDVHDAHNGVPHSLGPSGGVVGDVVLPAEEGGARGDASGGEVGEEAREQLFGAAALVEEALRGVQERELGGGVALADAREERRLTCGGVCEGGERLLLPRAAGSLRGHRLGEDSSRHERHELGRLGHLRRHVLPEPRLDLPWARPRARRLVKKLGHRQKREEAGELVLRNRRVHPSLLLLVAEKVLERQAALGPHGAHAPPDALDVEQEPRHHPHAHSVLPHEPLVLWRRGALEQHRAELGELHQAVPHQRREAEGDVLDRLGRVVQILPEHVEDAREAVDEVLARKERLVARRERHQCVAHRLPLHPLLLEAHRGDDELDPLAVLVRRVPRAHLLLELPDVLVVEEVLGARLLRLVELVVRNRRRRRRAGRGGARSLGRSSGTAAAAVASVG